MWYNWVSGSCEHNGFADRSHDGFVDRSHGTHGLMQVSGSYEHDGFADRTHGTQYNGLVHLKRSRPEKVWVSVFKWLLYSK